MDAKSTGYGKLAATLKVLAESLPDMMSAMLRPDEERVRPLAGITDRIADHLNAEVCSIFLVGDDGKELVCREAHGYEMEVEKKSHSTKKGLTGRIFSRRCELVLNYSVQDERLGWVGAYDKELKTHCWSLLGVPILSSQQTDIEGKRRCLGVLKLENKRTKWSSITDGQFLKGITEKNNTPKAILEIVSRLSKHNKQYVHIRPLAFELHRCTREIRAIIAPGASRGDDAKRRSIMPERLEANLESIRWHTDCLHHEIDENIRSTTEIDPLERKLAKMTHALRLALRTYEPFSDEDLMLARHVSAMLAAVLDIDLLVYVKGWERIAHSLSHVSSDFFEHLEKVTDFHLNHVGDTRCFRDLAILLDSAIYISGTKGPQSESSWQGERCPEIDADYIARQVRSRSSGYRRLAMLRGLDFKPGESVQHPDRLYYCDSGQLKSALDVLVHNAFRYGAKSIKVRVVDHKRGLEISVHDDGVGLPGGFEIKRGLRGKQQVADSDGKLTVPSGEGMGLFNTRHSLRSFRAGLEYADSVTGRETVFSIILAPVKSQWRQRKERRNDTK